MSQNNYCSLCKKEHYDPVAISCGHIFCIRCIRNHWAFTQDLGNLCPVCWQTCTRQLTLVDRQLQENSVSKLAYVDEDGYLQFDLSSVQSCFAQSEISHYPVCLINVIGEKRGGKSFLMNYILRALHYQENRQSLSLGSHEDRLTGFEWKSGTEATTKGIWIWNKPFVIESNGKKVAVFVMDTEGSQDIGINREASIKLSTLSMLLSSHLIFNVSKNLKESDYDYLEMFLNMAEQCGKQQHLQYLDILVRDWHDPENCGRTAAQSYISQEIQKLERSNNYPKILNIPNQDKCCCHLLPHPGNGITQEGLGRLKDMNQAFQKHLKNYVTNVLSRTTSLIDNNGAVLVCAQIPEKLQEFVELLNKMEYNFSTPMQMYRLVQCQKQMEEKVMTFREFLNSQYAFLPPHMMNSRITSKSSELLAEFERSLSDVSAEHRENLLQKLRNNLQKEQAMFYSKYKWRFAGNMGSAALSAAAAAPVAASYLVAAPVAASIFTAEGAAAAAASFFSAEGAAAAATSAGALAQGAMSLAQGILFRRFF